MAAERKERSVRHFRSGLRTFPNLCGAVRGRMRAAGPTLGLLGPDGVGSGYALPESSGRA